MPKLRKRRNVVFPENENFLIFDHGKIYDIENEKYWPSFVDKKTGKNTISTSIYHHFNTILCEKLVASYFVVNDDPVNKKFVIHKNNNKRDDRCENLQWCTLTEYNLHKNKYLFEEFIKNIDPNLRYDYLPNDDKYVFFTNGTIYSKVHNKFMALVYNRNDYIEVTLWLNGKKEVCLVHQLMGQIFIPNPNPDLYKMIDHINRHRDDNNIDNLRWADVDINNANRTPGTEFKKKVHQYDDNNMFLNSYDSMNEASEKSGCPVKSLRKCCRGIMKSVLSKDDNIRYKWKYDDPEYEQIYLKPKNSVNIRGYLLYWITSKGEIWSQHSKRYMKYQLSGGSYAVTLINDKGGQNTLHVHRVVALHFTIPLPENYKEMDVVHLDQNQFNNDISNLKFISNDDKSTIHANLFSFQSRKVKSYNTETKELVIFNDMKEAGKYFNLASNSHIPDYIKNCSEGKLYRKIYHISDFETDISHLFEDDDLDNEDEDDNNNKNNKTAYEKIMRLDHYDSDFEDDDDYIQMNNKTKKIEEPVIKIQPKRKLVKRLVKKEEPNISDEEIDIVEEKLKRKTILVKRSKPLS